VELKTRAQKQRFWFAVPLGWQMKRDLLFARRWPEDTPGWITLRKRSDGDGGMLVSINELLVHRMTDIRERDPCLQVPSTTVGTADNRSETV
jgi:hypothetical protein